MTQQDRHCCTDNELANADQVDLSVSTNVPYFWPNAASANLLTGCVAAESQLGASLARAVLPPVPVHCQVFRMTALVLAKDGSTNVTW